MAIQIAPIAKPINANFDPFTSNFEIRTERIILIVKAPINEPKGRTNRGADGNIIMIITAAKLAPFVIPITSGEASGFLITPCITEPEIAKLLPISNPKSVLGIRYSFKIKSLCKKKPVTA